MQKLVHAKKNFLRRAKISTNKVSGCPKAKSISGDILIWRKTLEEQKKPLKTLLQTILDSGLNPNHCQELQIPTNANICHHQNYIQ